MRTYKPCAKMKSVMDNCILCYLCQICLNSYGSIKVAVVGVSYFLTRTTTNGNNFRSIKDAIEKKTR